MLCEEKVNGLAVLIHRAVEIAPLTFDTDGGFVHAPADPDQPLAPVKRLFQHGAPHEQGTAPYPRVPHMRTLSQRLTSSTHRPPAAAGQEPPVSSLCHRGGSCKAFTKSAEEPSCCGGRTRRSSPCYQWSRRAKAATASECL